MFSTLLALVVILLLFWLFGQTNKPRKSDMLPRSETQAELKAYEDHRKFENGTL